jgi:hypothetical protein
MSSTVTPITDADILVHVVAPAEPTLPEASARSLLELRFDDQAVARMNELAEKNCVNSITDAERQELESFQRVGHLLNLLQAKARLSLSDKSCG